MNEKPARREIDAPPQPRRDGDSLVMRSVVSHDTLLGMIEQRNPILARRGPRPDRTTAASNADRS